MSSGGKTLSENLTENSPAGMVKFHSALLIFFECEWENIPGVNAFDAIE
jgi:hypothetical protein